MTTSVREHIENHPNVQELAALWGISAADVADAMTRLAKTLQYHQDAIENAHAAMQEAKAGRSPRGRAAQRSPYDVGRRR